MAERLQEGRRFENSKKKYQKKNNEHNLKKRVPRKQAHHVNSIYANTKIPVRALLLKCEKLIQNNANEIMIYCMGAAILRGINLALQVCEKFVGFQFSVSTSTIEVTDDLEPLTEDADFETQKRTNSVLHILLQRIVPIEPKTD